MKGNGLHNWLTDFIDWIVRFWWVFPLITALFIVGSIFLMDWNITLGLLICFLSAIFLLLQLPVFIILLVKKKWWRALGAFLSGAVCFVLFVTIPLLFIGMFFDSAPDNFGKEHPIPEGLEYCKPLGSVAKDGDTIDAGENDYLGWVRVQPTIDSTDTTSWLQIWYGIQNGIYNYAFYWPALEDGEVYLRCFEVTENIELSKDRMKPRTITQVLNHNNFGQIVEPNHKDFTIYEGDWEDYYAVRVEVWHKPTKGKARKLMEKIYRMDGWMR